MKKTPNYNLMKPDQTDFYDVDNFNENADIIDRELKSLQDAIGNGTAGDTILARLTKLEGYVGNLNNLETEQKASLVAAINEVRKNLMEHINDTEKHLRAGERDKINNALQPNTLWFTSRINIGDAVAERDLGIMTWVSNGVSEHAYIIIPFNDIFGSFEVTLSSGIFYSNAIGSCTAVYDVGGLASGELLLSRKKIMSMSENFSNNFYVGDLVSSPGWAYIIPIIKRSFNNDLRVSVRYNAVGANSASSIISSLDFAKDPPRPGIDPYPAQKDLDARINELFTSVSNGKAQVANAITQKGVPTAADAEFATMANNVRAIETRRVYSGTATGGSNLTLSIPYNKMPTSIMIYFGDRSDASGRLIYDAALSPSAYLADAFFYDAPSGVWRKVGANVLLYGDRADISIIAALPTQAFVAVMS